MTVRFAEEKDLERINELRRQVNDIHVEGKPEIFKAGFPDELRDYIYEIFADPDKSIVAAETDGIICGFAVIGVYVKPETPFMYECRFLEVYEFGVDKAFRRNGAGSEIMKFIRAYAAERGIDRIELDMWEFNDGALKFYEQSGFTTYRRYMEMKL